MILYAPTKIGNFNKGNKIPMFNFFKKLFSKSKDEKQKCYYEIKCPYTYKAWDRKNRGWWIIYTQPLKKITNLYQEELGEKPMSFFDCGCANGQLLVQAEEMGMRVNGIDIKEYKPVHPNVTIGSILDYQQPINHDLVYCNEVLTCVKEKEIPAVLDKFKSSKMVIAIHLTTEDDEKAGGTRYREHSGPRVIKSQKWWVDCFNKNGFNAKFHEQSGFFIARPRERDC